MLYELVEKMNLSRHLHSRMVFVIDIFVDVFASLCAITFISIVARNIYSLEYMLMWIIGSGLFSAFSFLIFKNHVTIISGSALKIISKISLSIILKDILLGAFVVLIHLHSGFSFPHLFALLIVDGLATLALILIERMIVIFCYDVMRLRTVRHRNAPEVFVYGVDEDAISFVQLQDINPRYHVAGFLTFAAKSVKDRLFDKQIYTFKDETSFSQVVDSHSVDCIVFISKEQLDSEMERLVKYCQNNKVRILFAPPVEDIVNAPQKQNRREIREIRIEDLLGRKEIKINIDKIIEAFRGRVIMVTGAAGSIGSELCRQLANFGIKQLILFDNAETPMHNLRLELEDKFPELDFVPVIGDIRYREKLDNAFSQYHPQVVFHAGAYKHVPLMEENPCEAVLANVVGSRNVADMCIKYDAERMVMISTDKAVNPTNIMGCTKRLAEIYVQSLSNAIADGKIKSRTKFVTTRFGNVLGSNGSVIPRFREQIAKGGPVTVTHPEITRFFMTIPEACRLVMEAATMGVDNKICVFDMGESVKISTLATRMIELAGFIPGKDIKIEYTGLRPGEKLYEEVLATEENTIPTEHSSIRIAKVRQYDYEAVIMVVKDLETYAMKLDVPSTVRKMKYVVPEFKSNNSEFQKYDEEIDEEIIHLKEKTL